MLSVSLQNPQDHIVRLPIPAHGRTKRRERQRLTTSASATAWTLGLHGCAIQVPDIGSVNQKLGAEVAQKDTLRGNDLDSGVPSW